MALPFASSSIPVHLVRGVLAIAALTLSLWLLRAPSPLAVPGAAALGVGGLVLLRGCPMCWTIGLVATISASLGRRRIEAARGVASLNR